MFPRTGFLWKHTPISTTLLGISFGVPSKGALPPSPLMEPPRRETTGSHSLLHSYFQSPRYTSTFPGFRFPLAGKGVPMERDTYIWSLFYIFCRFPGEGAPSRPSPLSLFRERHSTSTAPFIYHLISYHLFP